VARLLVDFEGEQLRRLQDDAVVAGVVTVASGGDAPAGPPQPAEILEQQVMRNPVTGGWRLVFQVKLPDGDPVDLRGFLQYGDDVLTETWSYLLQP
jgi:glucans biosynthesis protein